MKIKNKFKDIILRFLCLVLCFSMVLSVFACAKDKNEQEEQPSINKNHIQIIKETDSFLISNKSTEYKVLLSADATTNDNFAANEVVNYIFESTSVKLQVVDDTNYDAQAKYISIGTTKAFTASNIVPEEDLGAEGYVVKTQDKSIFIYGSERGKVYAAYEFLNKILNLGFYSNLYYDININVTDIKLMDYYIKEIPDFKYRPLGYKVLEEDTTKLKFRINNEYRVTGAVGHNVTTVIDKKVYFDPLDQDNYRPQFYFVDHKGEAKQLCFTAKGNEEDLAMMIDIAVEFYKNKLIADTNLSHNIMNFAVEDGNYICRCEACVATANKYNGSESAAVVMFANSVYDKLQQWLKSEEGQPYDREISLVFYAYAIFDKPPVHHDQIADTFTPIDDLVICREGVVPYIPCWGADYTVPFSNPKNLKHYNTIRGWAAVSKMTQFYMYSTNYDHYFAPHNTFGSLQENHQFAKSMNSNLYYSLGQSVQQGRVTAWDTLKIYLQSKLAWNVDSDFNGLIDDFFNGYFKDAAPFMREWFDDYRMHSVYIENAFGKNGYSGWFKSPFAKEYWSEQKLNYWFSCAENAMKAIEYLKWDNPSLYEQLKSNIECETLSLWYLYIGIYSDTMTPQELLTKKLEFRQLVEKFGISHLEEGDNINILWQNWGIA